MNRKKQDLIEEIKYVLTACGNYHNGRTSEVCAELIKKIDSSGVKILY
tara:strand:+ start:563 stop:706 length:144 start_codon:yes stop_codon:yes gene_type:complete